VSLKVATINILNDLSHWEQRRGLIAQGLAELEPDLIALQEVNLPVANAQWIAAQLGLEAIYISPKTGSEASREGIAILSRAKIQAAYTLELGGQGRIAQAVEVIFEEKSVLFVNIHAFWQPGESLARNGQIEQMLAWLAAVRRGHSVIICGDFNDTPESKAIQRMRQDYASAYASFHGREPKYTCPTPLKRDFMARLRTIRGFITYLRPLHMNPFWRGTLDYIFIDSSLHVVDCCLALDQPSPADPRVYPSDHFRLCATLD
jgi:endonuclease/exonuclease/phosphatase family metal-dependent hydrolase